MTLVSAAPDKVICELKVEEDHTNKFGTLHGGLTATLIDSISTMALMGTERGLPGVSVDMNITYVSRCHPDDFFKKKIILVSNNTILCGGNDQNLHLVDICACFSNIFNPQLFELMIYNFHIVLISITCARL